MNKYTPFFILLAFISISFFSCKKKEVPLEEKIKKEVEEHYLSVAPDSLTIVSIDTISSAGYANLMLEMLENMRYEIEYQYKDAIFTDNETLINEIESSMMDIDDMITYFMVYSNSKETKKNDIILYMVSVNLYKNGETEPGIVFLTKDLVIHELDPFNNNLLDTEEMAGS